MKLTNSLVCSLLVIGLLSAIVPPVLRGATIEGPAAFKLRLTRLTVLDRAPGGEADQAATIGVVTVYGVTIGTLNLAKKLTYPTFVAKKSQTYQVKFYLDFLTTATTTLHWIALGSGPMIVGLSDNKGMSVVKNTTYRAEFSLDQAYIRAMALGIYDIVVALGPKPIENQLTGSGGMTMATIRIRFDQ
jgi:hypothetical protein